MNCFKNYYVHVCVHTYSNSVKTSFLTKKKEREKKERRNKNHTKCGLCSTHHMDVFRSTSWQTFDNPWEHYEVLRKVPSRRLKKYVNSLVTRLFKKLCNVVGVHENGRRYTINTINSIQSLMLKLACYHVQHLIYGSESYFRKFGPFLKQECQCNVSRVTNTNLLVNI